MKKKLILALLVLILFIGIGFWFFLQKSGEEKIVFFDEARYSLEPTGLDLIEKDLVEGKIDLDTALIYKVKFLFGDPNLPKEYLSKNTPFEDMGVFVDIQENWDNLSEETKNTLKPYFLRPDDPESFINKVMNGEIKISRKNDFKIIQSVIAYDRPVSYKSDDSLLTADNNIKVWYLEKKEVVNNEEKITKIYYDIAKKVVNNLNTDNAYPQFVGLLGKIPPSDGALGGDSKTDIYIVPENYPLFSGFGFSPAGLNVPDNVVNRSSFILIRDNLNDVYLKTTTVHELFHAFQRAFECSFTRNNLWWIEGTATWSEDFIYSKDNTEQGYVSNFITKPEKSLFENGELFEYGAYLFPFYLFNNYERTIIAKIFEGCQGHGDPLKSAEDNIEGGFKKNWKEFTLWNYNQKPVLYYKEADASKKFPTDSSEHGANAEFHFLPSNSETNSPVRGVGPLTAEMDTYSPEELETTNKMVFKNLKNFNGNDKAGIKALIFPQKAEPYFEDWTDLESRSFCFDIEKEDLNGVVLIFSNANIKDKISPTEIKVITAASCYEIDQGEILTVRPNFALSESYRGTLKYKAEGSLVKNSVPANAKYPYLGKWQVNVSYLERFPGQSYLGLTAGAMDFAYDHILEFDLSAESVLEDGTFEIKTKAANFKTPGWEIYNELTGEITRIPQGEMDWSVVQEGKISEITEKGAKISLPDFVLYNSGGYRDLPHPIILEIKSE